MLPQEIIRKKRCRLALTDGELKLFFRGYLSGKVADYQVSAMLMAILLNGMERRETSCLTQIMRDSGEIFAWPYAQELIIDKHSTGGIGDKTSMPIVPLCLLAGLKIPMIAGRGLGHTGGTLDKLEAIGWQVFPTKQQAVQQMDQLGGMIIGQTASMVPLDRQLYAMRDVTATVESIPLIVASILSKKLAEGIGGLVMDVKYGSGAFMQEQQQARELAQELKAVGESCGIKVRCLITDMNSPLGRYAGNALEIFECLEILRGAGPQDTRELTLELAAEMVHLAFPQRPLDEIREELQSYLHDGQAYQLFLDLAAAQGGDLDLLHSPEKLLRARHRIPVLGTQSPNSAVKSGDETSDQTTHRSTYVERIDVRALGIAVLELGGGRKQMHDHINPWVGLADMKHVGEELKPGEPVAIVHADDAIIGQEVAALVARAYTLNPFVAKSSDPLPRNPLIIERL